MSKKIIKNLENNITELEKYIFLTKNEISFIEKTLSKLEQLYLSYNYIQFKIASPQKIRNWTQRKIHYKLIDSRVPARIMGEVNTPETINFRTKIPHEDGMFSQRIFGPSNNWICACGRYKSNAIIYLNRFCEKCLVEITEARVRRYRMGYIQLSIPITHFWYFKGVPNYLLYLFRFYFPKLKYMDLHNLVYNSGISYTIDVASIVGYKLIKQYYNQAINKGPIYKNRKRGPKFLLFFLRNKEKLNNPFVEYFENLNQNLSNESLWSIYYKSRIFNVWVRGSTLDKTELLKLMKLGNISLRIRVFNELELDDMEAEEMQKELENLLIIETWVAQGKLIYRNNNLYTVDGTIYDYIPFKTQLLQPELNINPNSIVSEIPSNKLKNLKPEQKKNLKKKRFTDEEIINIKKAAEMLKTNPWIKSLAESVKKMEPHDDEWLKKYLQPPSSKNTLENDKKNETILNVRDGLLDNPKIAQYFDISKNSFILKEIRYHELIFPDYIPDWMADIETTNFFSFWSTFHFYWRQGSEIVQCALQHLNPQVVLRILLKKRKVIGMRTGKMNRRTFEKYLFIFHGFSYSKTNPGWIILNCLPVLPPTLRPFVEVENGHLVVADLNELYRLVLIRNNGINSFFFSHALQKFSQTILQEVVDSLINNARVDPSKIIKINDRHLRGFTEILEGKFGRFRYNLLGKRVDYSGRSVIVVNPKLNLYQCGLPYLMAVELYKYILVKYFIQEFNKGSKNDNYNFEIRKATILLKKNLAIFWPILEILMNASSVLLNRAPTLHKFGVQCFQPMLILGKAIHLHPLVCAGFNADFDGDQMAVHLLTSKVSQFESQTLMKPSVNILSQSNGEVILKPSQDVVIGCFYLSILLDNGLYKDKIFFTKEEEVFRALYHKKIDLNSSILFHHSFENYGLIYNHEDIFLINRNLFLPLFRRFFSPEKIQILKIFKKSIKGSKEPEKIYIFTNVGIFLGKKNMKNFYQLTDFFIETTPGRLFFDSSIIPFFINN